jgi:hypothetical protein
MTKMTEIKIADLLYVQKQNIKMDDFSPWLCILIKNQAFHKSYDEIHDVIPDLLALAGIHVELSSQDMRNGIDLAIPYDKYVQLVEKGIAETGYGEWMLEGDIGDYIPYTVHHLEVETEFQQFKSAMTMMRVGILVEILAKDPEAVIRMD